MLQKWDFEGPGICPLCRSSDEMSSHLFASCSYVGSVWNGMIGKLEVDKAHEAYVSLEEKTKAWWNDERVGPFEAFPILFAIVYGKPGINPYSTILGFLLTLSSHC